MAIDVGSPAIDRPATFAGNFAYILLDNPANETGDITDVEIWAASNLTLCIIATLYGSAPYFTCRDNVHIGSVTAGSKQSFSGLSLKCQVGDYIGISYYGGTTVANTSGFSGLYWREGNEFPVEVELHYSLLSGDTISVIGFGITIVAPTVTTQAVSSIQATTATGNGNITLTGGENCSKRGICWNTTGNPDVNDSKSEQTGSFSSGAFSRSMTGLTPGEKYYVKAYAYNSTGYGYGGQVTFTTTQLVQPPLVGVDSEGLVSSMVLGVVLSPPLVAPDSEGLNPDFALDNILSAPTATIGS